MTTRRPRGAWPGGVAARAGLPGLLALVLAAPLDAQVRPGSTDPWKPTQDPSLAVRVSAVQPAALSLAAGGTAGTVQVTGWNLGVLGTLEVAADPASPAPVAVRARWVGPASEGPTTSTRTLSLQATVDAFAGSYRVRARTGTIGPWVDIPLTVRVERPAGTPSASGRFRLTLNGFTVKRATWDHALQVDGKGDEVFFTAHVTETTASRGVVREVTRQPTPTYGDVNGFRGRIRAGTASSTQGGLRDGDSYPTRTPWARTVRPEALRLPWILWEGTLTQGEDAIIVLPAVWEMDGGRSVFGEWVTLAQETCGGVALALAAGGITSGATVVSGILWAGFAGAMLLHEAQVIGQAQDRPIGMDVMSGEYRYRPRPLVLTYGAAEASRTNDLGRGPGVVTVTYKDPDNLRGEYLLYFQIERLP